MTENFIELLAEFARENPVAAALAIVVVLGVTMWAIWRIR